MSIASEISRLQSAKSSIKTSIANKGVEVADDAKLDSFSTLIDAIAQGGSGLKLIKGTYTPASDGSAVIYSDEVTSSNVVAAYMYCEYLYNNPQSSMIGISAFNIGLFESFPSDKCTYCGSCLYSLNGSSIGTNSARFSSIDTGVINFSAPINRNIIGGQTYTWEILIKE